jgi:polyadenylation factor subunit 2
MTAHKKQVNCCMWNKNGNWLASGSKDGMIKLYDIRTMREIESFRGHNSDVSFIVFHIFK